MAHSNRLSIHWLLVLCEIAIFIGTVVTAYLSEVENWQWFVPFSGILIVLYIVVKLFDAFPQAKELLACDDVASNIARAALPYGIQQYFNMQSAEEQTLRNTMTQKAINNSQVLWLCANSGASYLDPSIYRHWPFIEKRLKDGIEFRVVILDPFSEEKGFRNQLNVGGEQFDSKVNIANLIKLHNTYSSLELRFVKYGMHATVFATNDCLFFDPYHVGTIDYRIENRSFCLRIEEATPKEGVGFYRLFKSHFASLWHASVTLEQWINDSKKHLPKDLPEITPRQYRI